MRELLTCRVGDANDVHTRIHVYNRGGYSGTLVVNTRDADEIIERLTGGQDGSNEGHGSVCAVEPGDTAGVHDTFGTSVDSKTIERRIE